MTQKSLVQNLLSTRESLGIQVSLWHFHQWPKSSRLKVTKVAVQVSCRHIPRDIPRGCIHDIHATAFAFPEPQPMASPTNGINARSRNRPMVHFWKMHENALIATVKPRSLSRLSFSFSFHLSIFKVCLHNVYVRSKQIIRSCKSTKDLRKRRFQSLHFAPTSPRHIPGDLPLEFPLPWKNRKTGCTQELNGLTFHGN